MATETRRIGLSLGADICWPICYQELLRRLDLNIEMGGKTLRFESERVTIEPFDLRQPCQYDVVLDRLTHWYHLTREWIKKSVIMDDLYVLNNPWSVQSMEKATSYSAMMRLGLPIPATWMVPPKEYETSDDLQVTLESYAQLFDLDKVGEKLGYPMYMKPYDGGGWVGVSRIDDAEALKSSYEKSGKFVMHLQRAVEGHDLFVRSVGLGPQTRQVLYDPDAPLHDRYTLRTNFLKEEDRQLLEDMTLTINTFFGWDFNSCEALRGADGVWAPIDFANPCPDSQVTSLHYHFPWLIMANIKWSVFCAATQRKMRLNLDWQPYFDVADPDMNLHESMAAFAKIARNRLESERFEAFCAEHLSHIDEVAHEFFSSDIAKDAVRQKVAVLFPDHEIDEFTDLFFGRIQSWREDSLRQNEASS